MLNRIFWISFAVLTLVATSVLVSLPTPKQSAHEIKNGNSFLINNVTLFDGNSFHGKTSITVDNGVITGIGKSGANHSATIIDGAGKTVIPGIIDAHTHSYGSALQEAINFGVTTHLDMFTAASLLTGEKASRDSTAYKSQTDLFSSGMLATAPGGHGTQFGVPVETLANPEHAADWVSKRITEGSDYIKLVYFKENSHFDSISRATAAALIKEAHKHGLLALAHISSFAGAQDMLDEGIDGLVHTFEDKAVTPEFLEQAKQQGLFVIPTLSVIASANKSSLGAKLAEDPDLSPYLTERQKQALASTLDNHQAPGVGYKLALENTKAMHDYGIPILAGTDAPNPGTVYGASIHQELSSLVEAGFNPIDALRASTSVSADAFKLKDRGHIAVGKRADFVVLNKDPRESIKATRSIHQIFKNGYVVKRVKSDNARANKLIDSPELSQFNNGLDGPSGFAWSATDDSMSNGNSSTQIERQGDNLKITAKVESGFMFPWAGAGVFSPLAVDISEFTKIEFSIMGTPGIYRAMVFSSDQTDVPPMQTFTVQQTEQTVQLALSEFTGLSTKAFTGLAIVAGPEPGEFVYKLKNVKLVD